MKNIHFIEQAIIRPTLMLEFIGRYETEKAQKRKQLLRDIVISISIAFLLCH